MRARLLLACLLLFTVIPLSASAEIATAALIPPHFRLTQPQRVLGLALPQQSATEIDRIRATTPVYEDDFFADTETWEILYDGETSRYFKAGMFHVSVDDTDTIAWGQGDFSVDDFYLEVDTHHWEGPLYNQVAVLFRYVDDSNFYLYSISSDGFFTLQKLVDDEWTSIVPWTESDAIETGERGVNRIGVLAQGPDITLVINDIIVTDTTDDSFSEGAIALAAGTFEETGVDIAFDNLILWDAPSDIDQPSRPAIGVSGRRPPSGSPTPTPSPTPTTIPQAEPQSVEAIMAMPPTYVDAFDGDGGTWGTDSDDRAEINYVDEELHIRVIPAEWMSWSTAEPSLSDFLAEIDTVHVDGATDTEYGMLFRYTDAGNFYFYAITATGYFSLWKKADDEWVQLIDWTASDLLETGENAVNRLGVWTTGETLSLLIDGEVVAETEDDAFASGDLALAVGTFQEGDATIAFDNLSVWDLTSTDDTIDAAPAAPSPTPVAPSPTPTTAAVEDVTVEQPEQAAIEALRSGEPTFADDFRRDTGAWSGESTDTVAYTFQRRALQIQVDRENWNAWSLYAEPVADMLVEVDIEHTGGPEDAGMGIVFRLLDDQNFYTFRTSTMGTYSLWKVEDGEWDPLIDWTSSEAVDRSDGAVNRLTVLADGPVFTLAINDLIVDQIADDSLTSGQVGMIVTAYAEPGIQASFDNFSLWNLDSQSE